MPYDKKIDPKKLKPNPFSQEHFGDASEEEDVVLGEDIGTRGIQDKPQIAPDDEILSGHRRIALAIKKGIPEINCLVRDDLTTQEAKEEFILKDNAYRRHLNDYQLAKIGAVLEKKYKCRHGGDRKSEAFRDGKITHLEGATRDHVAKSLGKSGRTYYNVKTATKLAEEHKDQEAIEQLKTEKGSSGKIIKKYKQQKILEHFTVKNLMQEIGKLKYDLGEPIASKDWKAYKNGQLIIIPRFSAVEKLVSERFNCEQAAIPLLDYKVKHECGSCSFSLRLIQQLLMLAEVEEPLQVSINAGSPLQIELDSVIFFFSLCWGNPEVNKHDVE